MFYPYSKKNSEHPMSDKHVPQDAVNWISAQNFDHGLIPVIGPYCKTSNDQLLLVNKLKALCIGYDVPISSITAALTYMQKYPIAPALITTPRRSKPVFTLWMHPELSSDTEVAKALSGEHPRTLYSVRERSVAYQDRFLATADTLVDELKKKMTLDGAMPFPVSGGVYTFSNREEAILQAGKVLGLAMNKLPARKEIVGSKHGIHSWVGAIVDGQEMVHCLVTVTKMRVSVAEREEIRESEKEEGGKEETEEAEKKVKRQL